MTTRRQFLRWVGASVGVSTGAAVMHMSTISAFAAQNNIAYLSCAQLPEGQSMLMGLSHKGDLIYQVSLPFRGHDIAFHPEYAIGISIARQPNRSLIIFDLNSGHVLETAIAPIGHHFYGHGAFSKDGRYFYTSENDYEAGRGVIGVWSVHPFKRIGAFSSGGIGPHEIATRHNGQGLIIANGGLETHPETGRQILNLHRLSPNLTYISNSGEIEETIALPDQYRKNSIRHLSESPQGHVVFAMQWQGTNFEQQPLVALHKKGEALRFIGGKDTEEANLQGYVGSIKFNRQGNLIAYTSPVANKVHVFDIVDFKYDHELDIEDVCGLSPHQNGFMLTSGTGDIHLIQDKHVTKLQTHKLAWDNHLTSVNSFLA